MHVRVHINRDQILDVHGRDYSAAPSARHDVIAPISATIKLWAN